MESIKGLVEDFAYSFEMLGWFNGENVKFSDKFFTPLWEIFKVLRV